ncbi:hypothetical protein MJO28_016308 [Puccinia striiformis f. sp. tritici]|uniref:Uncharacterized protein n=1 Tax=Puccinia striiformis f. sp. tritici TaxID=168172 RepID=A0ACC0DMU8_9BASI|nr:hypothetical protein Pst134EB_031107 [Puccinia striiformis f. sp. tritici]KAI7935054.1 hypothetical protein MJO29_016317 [Puccinia striiformis f. sp. tritici]KAI7935437.1 hypothetical protein MJO28_016308 [Puccinia striiformis f. sp. tritici]
MEKLPARVIGRILELEPSLRKVFLFQLNNRILHNITRDIIYQNITITPKILETILNGTEGYAGAVQEIRLDGQQEEEIEEERLLERLPNLRRFSCSTNSIPSQRLTTLIGTHSSNLESFSLDIITPTTDIPASNEPNCNNPGRQRSHTTTGIEDSQPTARIRPIRWDAELIENLPPTLTRLSISSLSVRGARNLSNAFQALTWTSLTDLSLSKSLFIDDELMASIITGSKKLKKIKIHSMSGTKLTERGIELLFSGLDGLEEIELLDVEGRFSKTGWLKFEELPASLKSIRFGYDETGSYHSWTLDHLTTIISLLKLNPKSITEFSVTRIVPLPTLLPGRHSIYTELNYNNRTAPQRISKDLILSLVENGQNLRILNLDWWLISVEALEVIVKGLPNLRKLTALVDAPFHRIITSTGFVHSKIQTLTVSIPPEHTPMVQELAQPTFNVRAKEGSPTRLTHPTTTTTCQSTTPIPTRDLKKFIKRAGHLKEIIWSGRGGLGRWKFIRNGSSSVNVRVEFIPVIDSLPTEAFEYRDPQSPSITCPPSHYRTGSSPRQFYTSINQSSIPHTSPISNRRSIITNNNEQEEQEEGNNSMSSTTYEDNSVEYDGRNSSSVSLATSWTSSSCPVPPQYYSSSSTSIGTTGFLGRNGTSLEGIPGTPIEVVDDDQYEFGNSDHLHHRNQRNILDGLDHLSIDNQKINFDHSHNLLLHQPIDQSIHVNDHSQTTGTNDLSSSVPTTSSPTKNSVRLST